MSTTWGEKNLCKTMLKHSRTDFKHSNWCTNLGIKLFIHFVEHVEKLSSIQDLTEGEMQILRTQIHIATALGDPFLNKPWYLYNRGWKFIPIHPHGQFQRSFLNSIFGNWVEFLTIIDLILAALLEIFPTPSLRPRCNPSTGTQATTLGKPVTFATTIN